MMLSRRIVTAVSLLVTVLRAMGAGVSRTLAETRPFLLGVGFPCRRSGIITAVLPLWVAVLVVMGMGVSPALAETHPFLSSFGSFSNPNGIAVDESSGDVYVADIGTDTVSRFDGKGGPTGFPR
jgi:DNA-binding beta-propeller fold protein YncE